MHGKGKLLFKKKCYHGEFKNDKIDGFGVLTYSN